MEETELLTSIAFVVVLSVMAQWIAWRIKLPSILLLLSFGILAGPILHLLDTDHLMGELLFPVVSLSVAIILFEGGLTLRLNDLKDIGVVLRRLISVSVLVTWGVTTLGARLFLNLPWDLSILLGAILIVTGPTVVIPLLNQIRPNARLNKVLRWEGIMIDPIGVMITVLIFEQIILPQPAPGEALLGLIDTVIIGSSVGYVSARALIGAFRRHWVPEYLQNPVVLMAVLGAFVLSNLLRAESGLLTVTVMGIAMANQRRYDIRHIMEFKENLQVLLISSLFILLGARLQLGSLEQLGIGVFAFLGLLMFVARPLSVLMATWKSDFSFQEKMFISWMAPRGIVAASVASIFSLELVEHGRPEAEIFVPVTFVVIIVTVAIYGLTAGKLAQQTGLVQENPQGVLFIGAHSWARKLALHLQHAGFRVIMADSSVRNVENAIQEGLTAYQGDVLTESIRDKINFSGIGNVLALTPNDEVNSLASLHFKNIISEPNIFQLAYRGENENPDISLPQLSGQTLFGKDITYDNLSLRFNTGAGLYAVDIHDVEQFKKKLESLVPLFVITSEKELVMWTVDNPPNLQVGQTVIGLLDPADEDIVDPTETAFTPMPGILTPLIKDVLAQIENGDSTETPVLKPKKDI
jgi:NhaP-type Na+/H+ or K+/H+ antiporter